MKETKVIQLGDRIPKLKKQKGKKANRRLILYMSALFLLMLFLIYFRSPFSGISSITVTGNHYIGRDAVLKLAGIETDMSFFRIDGDEVEQKLMKRKEIQRVTVKKSVWNRLTITIQEHPTIGYEKQEDKLYPLLANGTRLEALSSNKLPVPAPVLLGFSEAAALQELTDELAKVPAGIFRSISEVHASPEPSDPLHIKLYMNEGYEVSATIRDFANRMEPYPLIIENIKPGEKVRIHVEVGAYIERLSTGEKKNEN